jgi:hypothetical protein
LPFLENYNKRLGIIREFGLVCHAQQLLGFSIAVTQLRGQLKRWNFVSKKEKQSS